MTELQKINAASATECELELIKAQMSPKNFFNKNGELKTVAEFTKIAQCQPYTLADICKLQNENPLFSTDTPTEKFNYIVQMFGLYGLLVGLALTVQDAPAGNVMLSKKKAKK